MTLATNNPRNIVELPWKTVASAHQYTIKVTCALSLEEPRWMLHVGLGSADDAVIWNYDTPDYNLIFNLITAECERGSYKAEIAPPEDFDDSAAQSHNAPGGQQNQAYMQQSQQWAQQPQPQSANWNQPPKMIPPAIPIPGKPNTTGHDLPSLAFGAAAASLVNPPPPVPPGFVTGQQPVIPQQAAYPGQSNPYAQPANPYAQPGNPYAQPNNPYAEQQPSPYMDDNSPFGRQLTGPGSFAQPGQQNQMPSGQGTDYGQQTDQPYLQSAPPQNLAQAASGPYTAAPAQGITPAAPPPGPRPTGEMPSSRLFTLPDPASVRNPAERLVDKATAAEEETPIKIPTPLPSPVKFDRASVDKVFKMLTDAELGFLSHGALMFFTVREFSRFQRNNVPFSIVLFELAVLSGTHWEPMPLNLVKDVGKQLFGVLRPLDLIAHYENQDFAILLPHTSREDSFTIVQRLHESLSSTAVAPGMSPGQAQIFCGVATIPDDCSHPGVAIAAALEAKAKAKATGRPVLRFCDI